MRADVRRARGTGGFIVAAVLAIACSSAGESQLPSAPTPLASPDGWLEYSDAEHGFSIAYPASFVVLPDATPPIPGLVKRVRFQDRQIASSPFADREPERMLIDIFRLTQPTELEAWLRAAGKLPPDAEVSRFSWPQAREAVVVRRQVAVAPNETYYFATDRWVYALTPLGDGTSMLATFKLSP
jgi:hypothetical protein